MKSKELSSEVTLLDKYKLLNFACLDQILTRGSVAVLAVIIERYFQKFGNSRASLSYLEAATGLSRRRIIDGVRQLEANQYIQRIRVGEGTRPSEYSPNFAKLSQPENIEGDVLSSANSDTTNKGCENRTPGNISSIENDTTSSAVSCIPSASSSTENRTQTSLHNPATAGVTVKSNKSKDETAHGLRAGAFALDLYSEEIAKITSAKVEQIDRETVIMIEYEYEGDGTSEELNLILESYDQRRQESGQGGFSKLLDALNLDKIDDEQLLVGKRFLWNFDPRTASLEPMAIDDCCVV